MNVVDASQKLASVSAVSTSKCPFCNCDPCDCDWGLSELFKDWNSGPYKALVNGLSSSCDNPSIEDIRLPVFDSVYNSLGTGVSSVYGKHYPSAIVDRSIYKVGDLVNYHPFFGVSDFRKPWLIKTVFSIDTLDCSYHDYEITDGQQSHLVTFNELRKVEEK